jgi:hypothetical protein
MARRQTPVLRNLDDPLKVFGLLSLRSCGLVLVFFSALYAVETALGLLSLAFRSWAFLAQIGLSGLLAIGLSVAERMDDEHLVPSAVRFFLRRRVFYSGAAIGRLEASGREGLHGAR